MTNNISFLTGIKDPHLRFDEPCSTEEKDVKVIHLVQSYPMHCPYCGKLMKRNGFRRKPVIVKGLPVAGTPTVLSIRKQQYLCPPTQQCPKTVTRVAQVQGIKAGCRIADVVKQHITVELAQTSSMTTIARQHNVSTNTVIRQLDTLEKGFKPSYNWLPATIAFDDFKSGQFAQSGMSMILMNPQNHRTIDIIQSRTSHCLRAYFLSHYSREARWSVRIVVVDLFQPYRKLIHEVFPRAMIVADHFHVIVQAYRALQSVRIRVMNHYGTGSHEYRALKRYWKLLMAKASRLDDWNFYPRRNFQQAWLSDNEVVRRLLNFSTDLQVTYDYYQDLILAVEYHNQVLLDRLIHQDSRSLLPAVRKVQRVLAKHRDEIIASFATKLTNGPIEGTNNKIKVIKRVAYGYRNFFHFRVRILMALKNSHLMFHYQPKEKTRPIRQAA